MQKVETHNRTGSGSPLDVKAKRKILLSLQALPEVSDVRWQEILVRAAIKGYQFPSMFEPKLGALQSSYHVFSQDDAMMATLRLCFEQYFQGEGVALFQRALSEFNPRQADFEDWRSLLLHELAQQFGIELGAAKLVDVAFCHGKVCWRLYEGSPDQLIHTNDASFVFTDDNNVTMTLAQFIRFKNSGKRVGSNRITLDRFKACFLDAYHVQAEQIWHELHQKGVLTKNNRLSDGWWLMCSDVLTLASVRADGISYEHVIQAVNRVLDHEPYAKLHQPDGSINFFRAARDQKQWDKKGNVQNLEPKKATRISRRWDVSPYRNLVLHRDTAQEIKLYGEKLNYDHSPSDGLLEWHKQQVVNSHPLVSANRASMQHQIDELVTWLKSEFNRYCNGRAPTQDLLQSFYELDSVRPFVAQHNTLTQNIDDYDNLCALDKEDKGCWYAIAIPESLHVQGRTYMKPVSEHVAEFALHADIVWYLTILKQRPADFGLQPKDFLDALGAFRTLFRANSKARTGEQIHYVQSDPTNWQYKGSFVPMLFHQAHKPEHFAQFDQLMLTECREFLWRSQGGQMLNPKPSAEPIRHDATTPKQ